MYYSLVNVLFLLGNKTTSTRQTARRSQHLFIATTPVPIFKLTDLNRSHSTSKYQQWPNDGPTQTTSGRHWATVSPTSGIYTSTSPPASSTYDTVTSNLRGITSIKRTGTSIFEVAVSSTTVATHKPVAMVTSVAQNSVALATMPQMDLMEKTGIGKM